jgi:WD40 repeat protein
MELTGHSGEVFCAKFDPNGNYIASGSMDRSISRFFEEFCFGTAANII